MYGIQDKIEYLAYVESEGEKYYSCAILVRNFSWAPPPKILRNRTTLRDKKKHALPGSDKT